MEHETLFDLANPELWVLVGLALFIGLLVVLKVLPGALFGALDAHAAKIKAELDEAQQLREEAQALLADVKAQREEAERQAKEEAVLAEKLAAAEARIQIARDEAMGHVRAVASETAAAIVEKLTGKAASAAELQACLA